MYKQHKSRKYLTLLTATCLLTANLLTGCANTVVVKDHDGSLGVMAENGNLTYALENMEGTNMNETQNVTTPSTETNVEQNSQASMESTEQNVQATEQTGTQTEASHEQNSQASTETTQSTEQASPSQPPQEQASQTGSQAANKPSAEQAAGMTAVELHGALSVDGAYLVDQYGEKFQLYGMSTHGIGWFPQYVNYDSFRTLRDDWNTNCVRLAMYTHEYNGYCTGGNKDELKNLVHSGVKHATDLGMYVIIDWHILQDQDPNVYKQDALAFFEEMSSTYADYDNVIYEICNEPNGYANWSSVKSYAEEVIPVIRNNDSDAVIIVGTPTWSQDIHMAAQNPLEYDNIMYALHFYAGTHKDDLRNRLDTYVSDGFPVFVSEFGICDASGNGALDYDSASKWMEVIEKHNVSFFCWNLANKNESSSVFKESNTKLSDWSESDMNDSGIWFRNYCRSK